MVLKDCRYVYGCHEVMYELEVSLQYELRKDIVEEKLSVHSRETV